MSLQAEEFARQLLEKTQSGKLKWQFVPDPEVEIYQSDAGNGILFSIKRTARGDDKVIMFELTEPGRVVLKDTENNFVAAADSALVREQAIAFLRSRPVEVYYPVSNPSKVQRFRLYSDLFYAARETAEGKDEAIEKAQQFLSKLA